MNSKTTYPDNEKPVEAWCDPDCLHVKLQGGRRLRTPLWWYPRLFSATQSQRNNMELMLDGLHWPDVDEDLSIKGMLEGWKYPDAIKPRLNAAE